MIVIEYDKSSIKLRGHANYAPAGQDIVCAGVSVLIQTLIQSVETLTADEIEYSMQPGAVDIKFWCISDLTRALISAFFIGIKGIAEAYPKNVKLTER